MVWIAVARGGAVPVFEPDGRTRARIPCPQPRVTSPCFGGSDLRDLHVVTGERAGHRPRKRLRASLSDPPGCQWSPLTRRFADWIRAEPRHSPRSRRRGREVEAGELGKPVERQDALVLLAVDDPGRVCANRHRRAEILARVEALRIAFHVRQLTDARPEPGLLLLARRSPEGAVEHGAAPREVLGEGDPVLVRRRHIDGEDERAGRDGEDPRGEPQRR